LKEKTRKIQKGIGKRTASFAQKEIKVELSKSIKKSETISQHTKFTAAKN